MKEIDNSAQISSSECKFGTSDILQNTQRAAAAQVRCRPMNIKVFEEIFSLDMIGKEIKATCYERTAITGEACVVLSRL